VKVDFVLELQPRDVVNGAETNAQLRFVLVSNMQPVQNSIHELRVAAAVQWSDGRWAECNSRDACHENAMRCLREKDTKIGLLAGIRFCRDDGNKQDGDTQDTLTHYSFRGRRSNFYLTRRIESALTST
jgi:hypothetical protein